MREIGVPATVWAAGRCPLALQRRMNVMRRICLVSLCSLLLLGSARASTLDLKDAVIVTSAEASITVEKAAQMLAEEILARTQARLGTVTEWRSGRGPAILLGTPGQLERLAGNLVTRLVTAPDGDEGFRVQVVDNAVVIAGNSDRAVLFGAGYLLRHLKMRYGKIVEVDSGLRVATAPKVSLRGHELGYRPKVNSYDGFTVEMWERYIRDLAVFGTNAIQLIPPRSDDADDSPHFPLPQIEMMEEMSRIADEHALDVWIWYPALDEDYSDPAAVEFALNEWAEVFRRLPRIDHVYVPGGDPGHTRPRHLMALLEKQTASLNRYHPGAKTWVAPEGFAKEWMEEFFEILAAEPEWLGGVVHGPWVSDSIPEFRRRVPERYPLRRFPDITHSRHCQYFVPDWDLAFMITQAREGYNPRPLDQTDIFRAYKDYTFGFVTYSEGVNDDVNKIVWSALGWDPEARPIDILREYARYFIGDEWADEFAQGLLALERNWRGPLISNAGVDTTLQMFRSMEKRASPQVKLRWRFQQALYRAYYDAYVRSRLIYETSLEDRAMEKLREAPRTGSLLAVAEAEALLDQALTQPVARDLRSRLFELAEALYQSIRAQLSVDRYQAISVGRGANLDTADVPLNNRLWLKQRFAEIRGLVGEEERLAAVDEIVNWTNPGPGGFYDDLGNPARQPHLVRGPGYPSDPAHLETSYLNLGATGFGPRWREGTIHSQATSFEQEWAYPISWWRTAGTLNDHPLQLRYENLDPKAQYKVRVVYGATGTTPLRMVADGRHEIHPWITRPTPSAPLEFDIPREATADGKLELSFTGEPGRGGNGRGTDVAEIWLMRKE
jgi:hypothetical protein